MTVVHEDDLPVGMQERHKIAHNIAKETFEQVWNIAVIECDKLNKQITGNDALSYLGTIVASFAARWLVEMNKIAQEDDAGITTEDMVKDTLNAIIKMLGGDATFEEEKPLPGGMKRLNKEKI